MMGEVASTWWHIPEILQILILYRGKSVLFFFCFQGGLYNSGPPWSGGPPPGYLEKPIIARCEESENFRQVRMSIKILSIMVEVSSSG